MDKVLITDDLFKNSKKGDKLSDSDRLKLFGADLSVKEYLDLILKDGDCPFTTKELRALKEQKRRALITYITSTFCNAKGQVYTYGVIDALLTKKRINVNYKKSASSLFEENRRKLEGDIVLKRKPGIKQTVLVTYKNYGAAQAALSKYLVNEKHKKGYAELEIDVPPGDAERILPVITKYEFVPEN